MGGSACYKPAATLLSLGKTLVNNQNVLDALKYFTTCQGTNPLLQYQSTASNQLNLINTTIYNQNQNIRNFLTSSQFSPDCINTIYQTVMTYMSTLSLIPDIECLIIEHFNI